MRLVPAEGGVGRPLGRVRDDGRVRVLMPLPDRDFDVTEVAVPWRVLRDAGCEVVFATEQADTVPAADPRLLTGVSCAAATARSLPGFSRTLISCAHISHSPLEGLSAGPVHHAG